MGNAQQPGAPGQQAAGRFITLEGGDGAGKTVQVARLAARLTAAGLQPVVTREPGGSEGAEAIRDLLLTGARDRWDACCEVLLHNAARRHHLQHVIRPALAAGRWVLSDRFADSTMAYQGYGHGYDRRVIAELQRLVAGTFQPDLTLILDVPADTGLRRARQRPGGDNRYERLGPDFHRRVRDGFRRIAETAPDRCHIVDAGAGEAVVAAQIAAIVERRFALPPGGP